MICLIWYCIKWFLALWWPWMNAMDRYLISVIMGRFYLLCLTDASILIWINLEGDSVRTFLCLHPFGFECCSVLHVCSIEMSFKTVSSMANFLAKSQRWKEETSFLEIFVSFPDFPLWDTRFHSTQLILRFDGFFSKSVMFSSKSW